MYSNNCTMIGWRSETGMCYGQTLVNEKSLQFNEILIQDASSSNDVSEKKICLVVCIGAIKKNTLKKQVLNCPLL